MIVTNETVNKQLGRDWRTVTDFPMPSCQIGDYCVWTAEQVRPFGLFPKDTFNTSLAGSAG